MMTETVSKVEIYSALMWLITQDDFTALQVNSAITCQNYEKYGEYKYKYKTRALQAQHPH
jgi:hypothetical protein